MEPDNLTQPITTPEPVHDSLETTAPSSIDLIKVDTTETMESPEPANDPVEAITSSSMVPVKDNVDETMENESPEDAVQDLDRKTKVPEAEHHDPRFIFPSGIPGMGNCILGPRIPGSSTAVSTHGAKSTISSATQDMNDPGVPNRAQSHPVLPHSSVESGKKRKLSLSEPKHSRPKAKRAIRGLRVINPIPPVTEQRPAANNDDGDGSEESDIARLVQNLKYILHPYTQLHMTCEAREPVTRICHALSARTITLISIMSLMTEAVELLKALRDLQTSTITKFSEAERVFLRVGLESFFYGTRATTQQTVKDIQDLEKWIRECDE